VPSLVTLKRRDVGQPILGGPRPRILPESPHVQAAVPLINHRNGPAASTVATVATIGDQLPRLSVDLVADACHDGALRAINLLLIYSFNGEAFGQDRKRYHLGPPAARQPKNGPCR
jgi:hypothetical protein